MSPYAHPDPKQTHPARWAGSKYSKNSVERKKNYRLRAAVKAL